MVVSLSISHGAFAWGQEGHKLICALAEKELTRQGREFVEYLTSLGRYLDNQTLAFPEACLWPDAVKYSDYRGSYETHFINIPATARGIDLTRDCGALDCIVAGIQRSLVYLSQPASGDREKARKAAALRFLGHLVGDLHQPLHVSHGEDWGGNKIRVGWFGRQSNLHRVWDHDILERAGVTHPQSLNFLASLEPGPATVDILAWMQETFTLARQKAYKGPGERTITSGDQLGEPYLNHAKPVAIEQLAKGGARLGALLNGLAAGEVEPTFMALSPDATP